MNNFETPAEGEGKLPDKEYIKKQTRVVGDEVLIVGLMPEEAQALLRFGEENHISLKMSDQPLFPAEISDLKKNGVNIPDGSVEILLGIGVGSSDALFEALGVARD